MQLTTADRTDTRGNVSEIGGSRLNIGTLRARSRQLGSRRRGRGSRDARRHTHRWTSTTTISGRVEGAGENIFIFTLHD